MATGYFAGLLAFVYRETIDGRRVTGRRLVPFTPPRWLLVPADAQAQFERRFKQAHVASMLSIAFGIQVVRDSAPLWHLLVAALFISVIVFPLAQWWATAGLPSYDEGAATLVPVRRFEMEERQARAMGPRTLIGFIVLSVLLAIPQAIVAVRDAQWWAWLGFIMFAGLAIFFATMYLRIRAEQRDAMRTS